MPLTLDDNSAQYQIKAYAPGAILVNDTTYDHSLIVTPIRLIENWPPQTLAELTATHFAIFTELKPTILLLGTGTRLQFPDNALYAHLSQHGIGIEIMDSRAACLTYNALTAENRHVAAALLIR